MTEYEYYSPQHIFMPLYGCKPCGGGSGHCLAVSLTCDLETGSVVVQKRSEEGEIKDCSDAQTDTEVCHSSLQSSDTVTLHPLLAELNTYVQCLRFEIWGTKQLD